ncbi:class I SAM-dependent methyltransferase [Nonomuraea mangrovi]|uniref:S-adenosyl-L-methionine-dependent methyltransferase n=1 Tax=Nonomuraea mangrovi TaxID=2316207 RepID=A0ABW4T532_9ACTN
MGDEVRAGSVMLTSDWMAVIRSRERDQADAYLDDPCAAAFVTAESEASYDEIRSKGLPSEVVPIRGRLGDQTLIESGVRQAVCLGSGTDSRAYRLPLDQGFNYFEVDLPGQLAGKSELLGAAGFAARCRVEVVEADLRDDGWTAALLAAGFDPEQPVHWIAEGLFYYLTKPQARALAEAMSEMSATGSCFTFDGPHDRFLTDPARQDFLRRMGELGSPFVGSFHDPVEWLAPYGWQAQATLHGDIAEGRCDWLPPLPDRLRAIIQDVWFVRARQA